MRVQIKLIDILLNVSAFERCPSDVKFCREDAVNMVPATF